ncbi:MAG: proline dehydrogenase family protein [Candidatus Methylomirabilia bacterium]
MGILRSALLKGSQSRWLATQVTRRRFARRAVSRFMPGEDLESALAAARTLADAGITTVLTYLGENVTELTEAQQVTAHYLAALEQIERRSLPSHLSVKLTQLGLDISRDACEAELTALVERAAELGNFICIDMESSEYTDATLEIFRHVRSRHANAGVCLQAYLFRTAGDLEALLPLSPVVRLVKGAYREPPNIAFPHKRDVDANFLTLATRLLSDAALRSGPAPGIATHDPRLHAKIREHAAAAGLSKGTFEFQMLYGIRREDQQRLAAEGYQVRVLISYGSAWFPWYMRRLAERPANLLFALRSLVLPRLM